MKIVITGASGLIGHNFALAAVRRGYKVTALYHQHLPSLPETANLIHINLEQPATIDRLILDDFPDAIINCAAISSPQSVEKFPQLSQNINVELPSRLAQLAQHISAKLIHISSDRVFSGSSTTPYPITAEPSPTDPYSKLKLEAEKSVLKIAAEYSAVLRIPIVTGNSPQGKRSIHEKLFDAWAQGSKPLLSTAEYRQPCSAENIAEVILELIERAPFTGIFQWTGPETISRYEIGKRILQHFGLPIDLIQEKTTPEYTLQLSPSPLMEKLKTQPINFQGQLEQMHIPLHCRDWYHQF